MNAAPELAKPSSHRSIDQFKPGETFQDTVFMVSQKDLRTTANGGLYIHLVFADRTTQVVARIWQATKEQFESIPEGGFIRAKGRVESYKGNLQVIVDALRPADLSSIDLADFMPATRFDVEEMWQGVLTLLRTIRNPSLLALMKAFIRDEALMEGFKKAPAAIQNHHAFIGGLLEHTHSLLEMAARIFGRSDDTDNHYPEVSRDLVLAGIFLHDIGKAAELSFETNFTYTTEGQLVGHIAMAAIWIDRKAAEVEKETGEPFPADIRNVLIHLILSHHGAYEFGSPKLPACPEALVIHYLDNLDAKVFMALKGIHEARKEESDFSEWIRPLETRVYKKDVMGCRRTRN